MWVAVISATPKGRKRALGRMAVVQSSFLAVMVVVNLFVITVIDVAFAVTIAGVDSYNINFWTGHSGSIIFIIPSTLVALFTFSIALIVVTTNSAFIIASDVSIVEIISVVTISTANAETIATLTPKGGYRVVTAAALSFFSFSR